MTNIFSICADDSRIAYIVRSLHSARSKCGAAPRAGSIGLPAIALIRDIYILKIDARKYMLYV